MKHLFQLALFSSERLNFCSVNSLPNNKQSSLLTVVPTLLTPAVVKGLPEDWWEINTTEKARQWLGNRLAESTLLAVVSSHSDELIGFVFIYLNMEQGSAAHIGYLLGEDYWGKGYATELLTALVEYYRGQSEVKTFVAGVEVSNVASVKVLQKLGFSLDTENSSAENLFYQLEL